MQFGGTDGFTCRSGILGLLQRAARSPAGRRWMAFAHGRQASDKVAGQHHLCRNARSAELASAPPDQTGVGNMMDNKLRRARALESEDIDRMRELR